MSVLAELRKFNVPSSDRLSIAILAAEAAKMNLEQLNIALEEAKRLKEKALAEAKHLDVVIEEVDSFIQQDAIADTLKVAPEILWKHARNAFKMAKEFDIPKYREGLQKAIADLKTYKVTIAGKRYSADIQIDLNRTAGSLEQYGYAIKATREALKIGVMPTETTARGEVTASTFWYEKLYKPGRGLGRAWVWRSKGGKKVKVDKTAEFKAKYWLTINTRIDNFGSFAPWWQLMDLGAYELSSDRGGIPLPPLKATGFVLKAELEIRKKFKQLFDFYDDLARKEINKIKLEYNRYLANIDNTIIQIRRLIAYASGERIRRRIRPVTSEEITAQARYNQLYKLAKDSVYKQLGTERLLKADKQSLEMLIQNLAVGETVYRTKIGGGVEIRTRQIERKLQYYR